MPSAREYVHIAQEHIPTALRRKPLSHGQWHSPPDNFVEIMNNSVEIIKNFVEILKNFDEIIGCRSDNARTG